MVGPLLTTGLTYLIPIPVLLLISVGFLARLRALCVSTGSMGDGATLFADQSAG